MAKGRDFALWQYAIFKKLYARDLNPEEAMDIYALNWGGTPMRHALPRGLDQEAVRTPLLFRRYIIGLMEKEAKRPPKCNR